jgi:hypothetical protein
MVRTLITPKNDNYSLVIPKNYIGKKVEVLLYALDELTEEKQTASKKPPDFFGILTKEEGEKFERHIQQMRSEWDRDI